MEDKDLACLTNGTTSARCGWKYVEAFPRHFLGQRQIEFYLHQGLQPGPTQVRLISPRFYPPKFPKSWDLGIILEYLVFLPSGNTGHLQMNVCVFLLSLWPLGRTRWPDRGKVGTNLHGKLQHPCSTSPLGPVVYRMMFPYFHSSVWQCSFALEVQLPHEKSEILLWSFPGISTQKFHCSFELKIRWLYQDKQDWGWLIINTF
jgi:hypothetical protein